MNGCEYNLFIWFGFSFVSRDLRLVEVAEELCSKPSECLTTIFVDDSSEVVSMMRQPKYAKYQVNIMIIPTMERFQSTVVVPVYCPFFATKLKVVNAWSPLKNTLLFKQTETECGHPLTGKFSGAKHPL